MKIYLPWLKDYIRFDDSPGELADKLTLLGTETDYHLAQKTFFSDLRVAKVISSKKHPNADRLTLCKVQTKDGEFAVVCGAPNVRDGMKSVFAPIGTQLTPKFKIEKRKVRGEISEGMLVAEDEIGLSDDHSGIIELGENVALTKDVTEIVAENATIETDVTPNRPDCLSYFGMARETAILNNTNFSKPDTKYPETGAPIGSEIKVKIENPDDCPRYACRIVENVTIAPSPKWLQNYLVKSGIRSINNVVDLSNFVLLETGQPLHTFDLDLIKSGEIHIRRAKNGEKFLALDEKEYELTADNLMICDGDLPVAIGGVMGGEKSGVSKNTTKILIESAYFAPGIIRKSSKILGLASESSKRFERGVDPEGVIYALERLAQLLVQHAGGTARSGRIDEYPNPIVPNPIEFRISRANRIIGVDFTMEQIHEYFRKLEFTVEKVSDDMMVVKPPTFRPDLEREIDLIEEVVRLYGMQNVESDLTVNFHVQFRTSEENSIVDSVKQRMFGAGFDETYTVSMDRETADLRTFVRGSSVPISNPLSSDLSHMRQSILPGLLRAISFNLRRQHSDIRFFEIGTLFESDKKSETLAREYQAFAGAITGNYLMEHWSIEQPIPMSLFHLKGVLSGLSAFQNNSFQMLSATPDEYWQAKMEIRHGDETVGIFGILRAELLESYDIDQQVFAFEMNFDQFKKSAVDVRRLKHISNFPLINRDFSLVCDRSIPVGNMLNLFKSLKFSCEYRVEFVKYFEGGSVPDGKASRSFRFYFRGIGKNLTDAEIDGFMRKILAVAEKDFQVVLR